MDIKNVLKNLEANNMEAHFVETKKDALNLVKEMLPEGATVSNGGSVTLVETGVMALLNSGKYQYLDRSRAQTDEERKEIYRKCFSADYYFCSANAITEAGELYNVDGNCNRISCITFGPKNVVVIAGINKIVSDIGAAVKRVKTISAPKNTKRLGCETYCAKTGVCISEKTGELEAIGKGCSSPQRICCTYLVSSQQRVKNRIKVILVNEELGY